MSKILRIKMSSLPTLARRVARELPGMTFEVSMSAHEGCVVVNAKQGHGETARAEFRHIVENL